MNCPKPKRNDLAGGNVYDKYRTKNPLYRFVTNRFLKRLETIIAPLTDAQTVLEVGCGEGYLLNHISKLKSFSRLEGIDISKEIIEKAKMFYPSVKFSTGSICSLNYRDSEFDLVLACEILEHLQNYDKALSEIKRVTKKYCIVSVPVEPIWRILNLARGAYIVSLGNTPGHIQHWNKKSFPRLLSRYLTVEHVYYPLPWQMALCRK